MTCYCHSAHNSYHRCPIHLEYAGHTEDSWVEADRCRFCLAEKLDKIEAERELLVQRWRQAQNPRQA